MISGKNKFFTNEILSKLVTDISVAFWVWDAINDKLYYNHGFYDLVGRSYEEGAMDFDTWENMLHPDDCEPACQALMDYYEGKIDEYEVEIRIIKGNGDLIWVFDKGKITKWDEDGKPIQLAGVMQDITERKKYEEQLLKDENNLKLAMQFGGFSVWEWDITNERINFDEYYSKTLGYEEGYLNSTLKSWADIIHKDDMSNVSLNIRRCLTGQGGGYDHKLRILKGDGNYIWVRDVGEVSEVDEHGKPTKIIGGRIDIDALEVATLQLENYQEDLERQIAERTMELQRRDLALLELNKISKKLMETPTGKDFSKVVFECLDSFSSIGNNSRLSIFRNKIVDGKPYCYVANQNQKTYTNKFSFDLIREAFKDVEIDYISGGTFDESNREEYYQLLLQITKNISFDMIDYQRFFPTIYEHVQANKPLNFNTNKIFRLEFIFAKLQGVKSMLMSPISINSEPWGFMLLDDIELNAFNSDDEKILNLIGAVVGQAIHKNELEMSAKLAIEESQATLKQAHEEALLSSKAKSNFLANMSHEIRTPMNAISGMTDIILREAISPEVVDCSQSIKRACDSLLAIINDVLDISKIESGKLDIVEGEYNLSDILNDVLTIATNRLELKPLMFISNFQHDLPNKLIGDDTRVKQVMVNIVNNAIKFTTDGSITFDVFGEYAGGLLELKFSVTDTGVGISQEDVEKLFIEFERVNTKKNRNIEGTGLGLAISKRLCEMMNGSIEVESKMGAGTKFTITVIQQYNEYAPIALVEVSKSVLVFEPRDLYRNSIEQACVDLEIEKVVVCSLQSEFNDALQENEFNFIFTSAMYLLKVQELVTRYELKSKIILLADTNDIKSKYDYTTIVLPASSISIADVINGKTMTNSANKTENNFTAPECTILVVDDNLVNIKVAQGLMRPYQFKIETAENGLEAVEKIKTKPYDLVFMDHMMPIMDGIDATTAVRALEGEYYQNLPIIALTANAIIGTKEMFINEGLNDFLAKPIKLSTLNEILAKWLPKEKQIVVLEDDEQHEEQTVIKLKIPNVDVKLGLQRVGGDFDTYIDILNMYYKDGIKKVHNVRDFYDRKDLDAYKIEVHALKSASAAVGAMDISEKARLLEEASLKADWTYINQNAFEFIDDFNILLENIRESLVGVVSDGDNLDKEKGDTDFFIDTLKELATALDNIDINDCDRLLEQLSSFRWSDDEYDSLCKINELVSSYEYDEAIEVIKEISINSN